MKVQSANVVTEIKTNTNTYKFESGFVFRKKDKMSKKKVLEVALKSAIDRFKEQCKDYPLRVKQKVESIKYFAYL